MTNFYCVPLGMFIKDTVSVFKRSNLVSKEFDEDIPFKVTQKEAFCMALCALWVMQELECCVYVKDEVGTYFTVPCIRHCFGKNFVSYFDGLDEKHYVRKIGAKIRNNYYYVSVNYFNIMLRRNTKLTVVREGTREYALIKYFIDRISSFVDANVNSIEMTTHRKMMCNDVKQMQFDFDKVEEKCKELYGFDFNEAENFFSRDSLLANYEYDNAISVIRIKLYCIVFQSGMYVPIFIDGRMYTPLDNLPREIIDCLYSSDGEKFVKLYDMKDSYLLGLFTFFINYAQENLENKKASTLLDYEGKNIINPHKFADRGRLAGCIEDVKNSLIKYAFSSSYDFLYNNICVRTVLDFGNYKNVLKYCKDFLEIVRLHKDINKYSEKKINELFKDIKATSDVYYVITLAHTDSLSFYVSNKYKAIKNSKIARAEITLHKKVILQAYIDAVVEAYEALLQFHAEESIEEVFGRDTLAMCSKARAFMNNRRRNVVDSVMDTLHSMYPREFVKDMMLSKKELEKEHALNLRTICKIAEGEALFEKVIPELKIATGCHDFIIIDDAIYCPESIVKLINKDKLGHEIAIPFIQTAAQVCINLNSYFDTIFDPNQIERSV